ncbi:TcpD family membrane protein [Enterococcus faecium]|uniref:Uncharacterized protein n=1 Tax=Enterococcus faecium TaxID=1352 RepID=A0A242B0B3_ENTFC|nr:TcpD family membrane protein [Enterococcus faecium]OTN86634.1 hypothetical protein A5810_003032 [Enterococcus faecium]
MTLKGILDLILEQGGYAVIMVVVFLGIRNFMKSKIGAVLLSVLAGAVVYFFLNDPTRVLDAIGKIIAKIFIN